MGKSEFVAWLQGYVAGGGTDMDVVVMHLRKVTELDVISVPVLPVDEEAEAAVDELFRRNASPFPPRYLSPRGCLCPEGIVCGNTACPRAAKVTC